MTSKPMLEEEFLRWVSSTIRAKRYNKWFLGPMGAAHLPNMFSEKEALAEHFRTAYELTMSVRTTAATYAAPHRNLEGACGFWAVIADLDFDRGIYEGMPRHTQEETILQVLRMLPPTTAVQTQNGYHIYWVLRKIYPVDQYLLIAEAIRSALGADKASRIATQCMALRTEYPKKSRLVKSMTLAGTRLALFPEVKRIYTLSKLERVFCQKTATPQLEKLRTMVVNQLARTDNQSDETQKRKEETEIILSSYDIFDALLNKGLTPLMYNGGKKVVLRCPYHNDNNPSAFINLDPKSEWYGMFFCSSARCGHKTTLRRVMTDLDIMSQKEEIHLFGKSHYMNKPKYQDIKSKLHSIMTTRGGLS